MALRSPNCVFVGHVDHGKSSLLEHVIGKNITSKEAGGITQKITAFKVDQTTLKQTVNKTDSTLSKNITVPGILFIDTPGHAAFTSIRQRGGSLADIAVLVIDIREGVKEQTLESIKILKASKTPFIITLNKVDLLSGWRSDKNKPLISSINSQQESAKNLIEEKVYTIVGELQTHGLETERFDRITDFTKQIAIVPTSAKENIGIAELIVLIAGLAQRFLESALEIKSSIGKGVILEVNETKGMGITANVLLYEGTIKKSDQVVIGSVSGPITTKLKGIFELEKGSLKPRSVVHASAAVTIAAQQLEEVACGMPLLVANKSITKAQKEIQETVKETVIENEDTGIMVKADTLGSLEALTSLLRQHEIPIRKTGIGLITKKDIANAAADQDTLNRVILGFNVETEEGTGAKVITAPVIYKIVEQYEKWLDKEKKQLESKEIESLPKPFKIQILKDHVFRQSGPAVVGVEVLGGELHPSMPLIKSDGSKAGELKTIQNKNDVVEKAEIDEEVAVSIPGVTVGRQINEEDILFSDLQEDVFRQLKSLKKYLTESDKDVLKEIAEIKRKQNSSWGI